MTKTENWTDQYFTPMYSRVYQGPLYHSEATEAEINFLSNIFRGRQAGLILDVGSGFGRHARGLMKQGFRVVGLDRYAHFLAEWPKRGRMVLAADMRAVPCADESFSGLYCIFNTFGYFDHPENMKMLKEWARVLRNDGVLVLQVPNRPVMAAITQDCPPIQMVTGDLMVTEQYSFDSPTKTMIGRGLWNWKTSQQEWQFALRLYTHRELENGLARAGFETEIIFEDFHETEFNTKDSAEMVLVARKRG